MGSHAGCTVRIILTISSPSLSNKMQTTVIAICHICTSLIVASLFQLYFRHPAPMGNYLITWKQYGVSAQVSLVIQGHVHWIFQ